jgi:hypothetical protein
VAKQLARQHAWRMEMIIRSKFLEWNPEIDPAQVDDEIWAKHWKFTKTEPESWIKDFMQTYMYEGRVIVQVRFPQRFNLFDLATYQAVEYHISRR